MNTTNDYASVLCVNANDNDNMNANSNVNSNDNNLERTFPDFICDNIFNTLQEDNSVDLNMIDNIPYPRPKELTLREYSVKQSSMNHSFKKRSRDSADETDVKLYYTGDETVILSTFGDIIMRTDHYNLSTLTKMINEILDTTIMYVHPLVFVNTCLEVLNEHSQTKYKKIKFSDTDLFKLRVWANRIREIYREDARADTIYMGYYLIFNMMRMKFDAR